MDNQFDKYQQAKEKVAALKKFYLKIIRSVIFVGLFAGLNYYVNEFANPWFLWIALFVSIGLVVEAIKSFGLSFLMGDNWEERKIKEYMDKDNTHNHETKTERWE